MYQHVSIPSLYVRIFSLCCLIAFPVATHVAAQNISCTPKTIQERFDRRSIALRNTFFSGYRYTRNGVEKKAGGAMQKLAADLKDWPESYSLAQSGVRKVKTGRALTFLGIAAGISTIFFDDVSWQITGNIGAFILSSIGTGVQIKGRNRVRSAIEIYNRMLIDC